MYIDFIDFNNVIIHGRLEDTKKNLEKSREINHSKRVSTN